MLSWNKDKIRYLLEIVVANYIPLIAKFPAFILLDFSLIL